MNQKGFAPLVVLIGIVIVSSLGAAILLKGNFSHSGSTKSEDQATTSANLDSIPTSTPSSSANPKTSSISSLTSSPKTTTKTVPELYKVNKTEYSFSFSPTKTTIADLKIPVVKK